MIDRKKFPVVKDVSALRCKGVMVETVIEAVEKMHPVRYAVYCSGFSGGIPTALIGSKSEADWVELRAKLRAMKLIR